MGRIISISNQKGGVAKTTTAINLAASLASGEHRTLLVDMDPQGNAGSGLGIYGHQHAKTVYDLLLDQVPAQEILTETELKFLQVIPSHPDLAGAELELATMEGREFKLAAALRALRDEYEYIIVDTPPSLGLLTLNALVAADSVIVPLQCEYFALEGISALMNTIKLVREHLNPTLELEGVLFTMYDKRALLTEQVASEVRTHFPDRVFETVIPRNIRLSECASHGKPIILYELRSTGSEAYIAFAREVQKRTEARASNAA